MTEQDLILKQVALKAAASAYQATPSDQPELTAANVIDIASELYDWLQGSVPSQAPSQHSPSAPHAAPASPPQTQDSAPAQAQDTQCPVCGGLMWDNRQKKREGKYKANAPDFRCRDKDCDGVVWPR